MTKRQTPLDNMPLYVIRQLQKPHYGCDQCPFLADAFGYLLLRKSNVLNKFTVCLSLLDGVELLSLDVLD